MQCRLYHYKEAMALFLGSLALCGLVSSILQVQAKGGCKALEFLPCVKNKAMVGHVIKSYRTLTPGLEFCQHECFMSDDCVSYNLGPAKGCIRTCELSNFDHLTLPNKVVSKEGYEYCAIKNNPCCLPNSCPAGKICIPDFSWDTVTCTDEAWSQWSNWTICNCPQTRTRSCENPLTHAAGEDCDGLDKDVKECKALAPINHCDKLLGMENKTITDSQMTASSTHLHCKPSYARLNLAIPTAAAWCARLKKPGEYLQVDLGSVRKITKIATQPRNYCQQRVTAYTLAYSNSTSGVWVNYTGEYTCTKMFAGNTKYSSTVIHELPVPITAQYIRVKVRKWISHPSIRVEFYGCS